MAENNIVLDGSSLTPTEVIAVARSGAKVELADQARDRILANREDVDRLVEEKKVVYGVTTGFGSLANVSIPAEHTAELQRNLLMSHAVGVGNPLTEDVVRAIMLLRVNTFAKGHSGVRLVLVERIIDMINKKVYPFVPELGSVGSSGDLCPLSHLFLVLLGKGYCYDKKVKISGKDGMDAAGIEPIALTAKEGLALNNGTQFMTAVSVLTAHDVGKMIENAQIAAAMTCEALKANSRFLDVRVHNLRAHPGQSTCATSIRRLISGSRLIDSQTEKVQDAYSIRAIPVVLGATIDALNHVNSVLQIEMNSATDNPLIIDGEAFSAANFHGQPIGLVMDYLAIAVSEVGNIAERRIARLVDSKLNENLPAFLVENSGLNSGFMIPQYTAAALVSENKMYCHPATADSIPTCANQEDHVSMGSIAARKVGKIVKNVNRVIAIELMCAAQALDFRRLPPSGVISRIKGRIRQEIPFLVKDKEMYDDLQILIDLVQKNELIQIADAYTP